MRKPCLRVSRCWIICLWGGCGSSLDLPLITQQYPNTSTKPHTSIYLSTRLQHRTGLGKHTCRAVYTVCGQCYASRARWSANTSIAYLTTYREIGRWKDNQVDASGMIENADLARRVETANDMTFYMDISREVYRVVEASRHFEADRRITPASLGNGNSQG